MSLSTRVDDTGLGRALVNICRREGSVYQAELVTEVQTATQARERRISRAIDRGVEQGWLDRTGDGDTAEVSLP